MRQEELLPPRGATRDEELAALKRTLLGLKARAMPLVGQLGKMRAQSRDVSTRRSSVFKRNKKSANADAGDAGDVAVAAALESLSDDYERLCIDMRLVEAEIRIVTAERDEEAVSSLYGTVKEAARSELSFLDKVGEGSFAVVHKAKWNSFTVAVKKITEGSLQRELQIMKDLPLHENILPVIGYTDDALIMPFMYSGDLGKIVRRDGEQLDAFVLFEIFRGKNIRIKFCFSFNFFFIFF